MLIEQAIYGGHDVGGYRFLARSPGFRDEWLPLAQQVCTGFGDRPAGVSSPAAVFALPLGARHVAVVQVADQGRDDAGRPGALAFRLLVLPQALYRDLGGDPFLIADAFPPSWEARGELPTLEWTDGPPPKRTIEQVRRVIDVEHDRTALLLGGVQVLVDGGRLVFERSAPDSRLLRDLWMLLPTATRTTLWPASFAFGNANRFQVVVVPRASGPEYLGYVPEAQAGDYPEGRYELALQTAVESGDEAEMDALFARRSRAQVLRLGVLLLLVFIVVPPLVLGLPWGHHKDDPVPASREEEKAPQAQPLMNLPSADALPPLTDAERTRFADRLQHVGRRLGVKLPSGKSERKLAEAVAELDRQIDLAKDNGRSARDPGRLLDLGPPQRQLRAVLWKNGVAEYDEKRLNSVELLERLEGQLVKDRVIKEDGHE
jgi:hypothetical protein